jgi:hypothetical protein
MNEEPPLVGRGDDDHDENHHEDPDPDRPIALIAGH